MTPAEPGSPGPTPTRAPTPSVKIVRPARSGPEQTRRIVVFGFGLIQVLVGLRIVLLLIDARADNALVATIMDASEVLVAPFRGILQSNVVESGAIVLDLAAVVALIGWTILEVLLYWGIGLFRREAA